LWKTFLDGGFWLVTEAKFFSVLTIAFQCPQVKGINTGMTAKHRKKGVNIRSKNAQNGPAEIVYNAN